MAKSAGSPSRAERAFTTAVFARSSVTAFALVLVVLVAVSVFVMEVSQPQTAMSMLASRRVLDEPELQVVAIAPLEHYSAPAPPLPEAVERAIRETVRRANNTAHGKYH